MKKASSKPLLNYLEEEDYEESKSVENQEMDLQDHRGDDDDDDGGDIDDIADQIQCMTFHKREPTKRGEELQLEKFGVWRQGQKSTAAKLEKQLKAKWALEDLMEEQVNRFQAHYSQPTATTRLKDVARLLVPKCAQAHEMAAQAWFGDWRPSAILDILRSLVHSSFFSLSGPNAVERALTDQIHELRIEEVVLDEEMAEIQSNCILHLPFGLVNNRPDGSALPHVRVEFNKIYGVFTKAQNLRFKALEMVKKVLSQTDAAEFLVAFAGIQDSIHQAASQARLQKGPVSLPLKALGSS